eukprot:g19307.t1
MQLGLCRHLFAKKTPKLISPTNSTTNQPRQTYGSVKFAARLLNLNETSKEHIFGGTRPLLWLRLLGALSRRRIVDLLNMPSISGPTSLRGAFWISAGGNHSVSHLHVKEPRVFGKGGGVDALTCHALSFDGARRLKLVWLQGCASRFATSPTTWRFFGTRGCNLVKGLFARGGKLVVRLRGCAGAWSDPGAPQGWYLWWLQRRFGSSALVLCDMKAHGCEGLTVLLHSSWHLLPFRSEHVHGQPRDTWRKLREAAELLNGGPEIFAVSLMEKSMQGLSALGRGGVEPWDRSALQRHSDWKTFVLAAPALSRDWNFKEAARTLTDIYNLFAETGANSTYWSVQEMVEAVQWCAHPQPPFPRYPCAPRSCEEDVWLLRSPNSGSGDRIALSSGLFQKTDGTSYDHSTSAKSALGIPPCYACHQAELNSKPFTLYISVLDVLGPCRELFSNLVLDTLEALQFASFQGPEVVLVEPFISNAVWRQFGEGDAELLHKAKPNASIYKFWNEDSRESKCGACGLRFGSVTPFGDLFDWRHLTQWLMEVRGIRGQISWEQFLRETGGQIDVLAMQAPHVDDGKSLPCADSKEEATLRFYQTELRVRRRVCVRSTKHTQGFELRFLDDGRLAEVVQSAVAQAKSERKTWTAVGLYLYWVEGAERARLHPGRYGLLSSHTFYTSNCIDGIFLASYDERARSRRFAKRTQSRAGAFLAVHWRKGDWFLGPHPRKLEQAQLAEPGAFALRLKSFLQETKLQRLFLMSNAAPGTEAVAKLRDELNGTAESGHPGLARQNGRFMMRMRQVSR